VPYGSCVDNAVTYTTPTWNGLSASATYAFGEVPGDTRRGATSGANVQSMSGPVYLMYAYQGSTNRPATTGAPQGQSRSHYIGGSYNFARKVELGGFYGHSDSQIATTASADYYALTMDWVASPAYTIKLAAARRVVSGMAERPLHCNGRQALCLLTGGRMRIARAVLARTGIKFSTLGQVVVDPLGPRGLLTLSAHRSRRWPRTIQPRAWNSPGSFLQARIDATCSSTNCPATACESESFSSPDEVIRVEKTAHQGHGSS
jgi:hypothetical protein